MHDSRQNPEPASWIECTGLGFRERSPRNGETPQISSKPHGLVVQPVSHQMQRNARVSLEHHVDPPQGDVALTW
jgi:hypothetical protein